MILKRLLALASVWLLFIRCSHNASFIGISHPLGFTRAHAHNDYRHERPLLDAWEHGFVSIEADVHLLGDQLFVAHDKEEIKPERTLQSLYLDPLQAVINKNKNPVIKGHTPYWFFIDIKGDADSTYALLATVFKRYQKMLTEFREKSCQERSVTIILSGHRPIETLRNQKRRFAAYDGRLAELDKNESPALMPVVSDKWSDHFSWYGKGSMPAEEKNKLQAFIDQAHRSKRRIRFWGTDVASADEQTALWSTLYEVGVDLINTDKLDELQAFLRPREQTENK